MNDGGKRSGFCRKVCEIVRNIPPGRVATYGMIAAYAGNPRGARTVAWILHSCSKKEKLPWHRVVNRMGTVSLRHGRGREIQKGLLEGEGVFFDGKSRIDFDRYLWRPGSIGIRAE
ncbi:MAG: MGMT family protein [Spirochaetes bacterium]|nr:MGMT family protein [Spirochaetota bacterium]